MLLLKTLGGLSLTRAENGVPIGGPRRKPLALLALLAASRHEGVPRDQVISLLWPSDALDRGRRALAQTIYALRRETGCRDIIAGDENLQLNYTVVSSDVVQFRIACEAGRFAAALDVYGGPFLDGVYFRDCGEFERWVESERARLTRMFVEAAAFGATQRARDGDAAGAAETWQRAFDADPLDSRIATALAAAFVAAHDRATALRVVQAHELFVAEHAGALPDAQFRAFAAHLRTGDTHATQNSTSPPAVAGAVRLNATGAISIGSANRSEGRRLVDRRSALRVAGLAACAATVILAASDARPVGGAGSAQQSWSHPGGDTASVVVLPFDVSGDTAGQVLGEGVAELLATAIDDAAQIRALSGVSAVRRRDAAGAPSRSSAMAVAESLGADFYVSGNLVRVRNQVRLTAVIHSVREPAREELLIEAEAKPDIFAGVDSLAMRILASRAAETPGHLVPIASRTTGSLEAFRDFLEGERQFRAGHYGDALAAYGRAVASDTGFALAYYRMTIVCDWAVECPAFYETLRKTRMLANRLPAREALVVNAMNEWYLGEIAAAEPSLRHALGLYPDDPEALYQLGELLFHTGYAVGRPVAEARPLFERVARLEPENVEAIAHLARTEVRLGTIDRADSLAHRVLALRGPADRLANELAIVVAMARGDRRRLSHIADSLSRSSADESLLYIAAWRGASYTDSVQLAYPFARHLAEHSSDLHLRTQARLRLAEYAALAGDQDRAIDGAADEEQSPEWLLAARGYNAALPSVATPREKLTALADSLRTVPRDEQACDRATVSVVGDGTSPLLRGWPLGLIALRLGDTTAALAAASMLDSVQGDLCRPIAQALSTSLRARVAWKRGDVTTALGLLELAPRQVPLQWRLTTFGSFALDRWQRAEWLRAVGRHEDALRWYATLEQDSSGELPFRRLAAVGMAASYEALGNKTLARLATARAERLTRSVSAELR